MKPTKAEFSLPYPDNSGPRLVVRFDAGRELDFMIDIQAGGGAIYVRPEDLNWLRDALYEVANIFGR